MKCKNSRKKTEPVDKLLRYLKVRLSAVGVKLTYSALLLFFAYNRSETPKWAKNIILGSLAYLVSPIDSIPDLTPFIGFTDDIGVMSFGLVTIACYINEDVRHAAKTQVGKFFKKYDEQDLLEVDAKL